MTCKTVAEVEESWIRWARSPEVLSLDMSEPRVSSTMKRWASHRSVKLNFLPKECHHELAVLEGNHAAKREHLEINTLEHPEEDLCTALLHMAAQRDRLRGVCGSTPAMIALGVLPSILGQIANEPFQHGAQHVEPTEFSKDIQRRVAAANQS